MCKNVGTNYPPSNFKKVIINKRKNNMVKLLKGNVVKCQECGQYLKYDLSDVEERECSYGVQTYAGETYIGKFITCPMCGAKIEVY